MSFFSVRKHRLESSRDFIRSRVIQEYEQNLNDAKKRGATTGHEAVEDNNEQEVTIERRRRHGKICERPRSRSRSRSEGPTRTAEKERKEKQLQMRRERMPDEHEDHSPVEDHLPVANGFSNVNQPSSEDYPDQWNKQYSYNGYWPSNGTPAAFNASTSYNPQSYWAQGYGRNPYSQPSAAPSSAPLTLNPFPDRPETRTAPRVVREEPDLSSEYEKFLNEVTKTHTPQEENRYDHIDSLDWNGGISRYSEESNLTQIKTVDHHSLWR